MTTQLDLDHAHVEALAKGSSVTLPLTPPSAARFDLMLVPAAAPPPPPPGSFWLPAPGVGWSPTPSLRQDFTTMTLAEFTADGNWDYSGAPGGTNNCEWLKQQVTLVEGSGAKITSQWDASLGAWISGAFGTQTEFSCPILIRWYDVLVTARLVGHNKVQLFWAGGWIEVDVDECSIGAVGSWGVSWARTHLNSSANHNDPMSWGTPQALGVATCNEVRLTDNGDGTGTYAIWRNGAHIASTVIDSTMWAALKANKHWIGTQDEFYSKGSGDQSQVDERLVLGIEVYTPA